MKSAANDATTRTPRPDPDSEKSLLRVWVGSSSVLAVALVVAAVMGLFSGSFTRSVPVVVLTERVGLVMNPDARVKMRDIQVGTVKSIVDGPHGTAAIHLALDPNQIALIPENVEVDIASSTIFGAKYIQLVAPDTPAPHSIQPGQVVQADHVNVEVNTLFAQLTATLSAIDPTKLNGALSALSTGLGGRGDQIGQTLIDLDAMLTELEPSLPALSSDLSLTPTVLASYADAAPDLIRIVDATTDISSTIAENQLQLDQLLLSTIGFAQIGSDVLSTNGGPLDELLSLLVPTTDLTNQYNQAIYCGLAGVLPLALTPPYKNPGVEVMAGFLWGAERWRYPDDLPKVAASGGPQCTDMPRVPYQKRPPFVLTDTNGNPWKYNQPGILLNAAGLKELLFGPIPGPPRNSAQIGQPG